MSYLRQHILASPRHTALIDLLSKQTQEALNSNFRTAKAAYFDANYSPLMQALTDDPKEKPGKAVTKEKFTRFFDMLDEVIERHKTAKVLEEDPQGREAIMEDVVRLVVPSLARFSQKQREKEFSKSELSHTVLFSRWRLIGVSFMTCRSTEMYVYCFRLCWAAELIICFSIC